jgi:hypothetical protein
MGTPTRLGAHFFVRGESNADQSIQNTIRVAAGEACVRLRSSRKSLVAN